MPQPINTSPRSFLGYRYQRSTTGDFMYLGRNKRVKTKKDKDDDSSDLKNKSTNISFTMPNQIPNLIGNGGGINYNAGPKDLQSSASTGNISGGTRAERKKLEG